MVSCEELFPDSITSAGAGSIQGHAAIGTTAAGDPSYSSSSSQNAGQQQHQSSQHQHQQQSSFSSSSSSSFQHNSSLKCNLKRSHLSRSRSGGIFSNPFRSDRDKMDQLADLLNQYSMHGIPESNSLLSARNKENSSFEERLASMDLLSEHQSHTSPVYHSHHRDPLFLEENWRSLVLKKHFADQRLQGQQDAIWELLTSEVFYIKRLRVVTDLFLSCLTSLQSECLLNDIDADRMFSNINQVYEVNRDFWINHLLPMLNASRSTGQKLDPSLMLNGFLKFEHLFQPYIKYCLEHSNCLQYVKEKHKENELFKAYVVWCETRKDCDRLRLMDLLVKPMQRLTKYSLILKAILRKTDADSEITAVKKMNECVEQFVLSVDASLRQRHEEERLAWIASRIESYDAIDVNSDEIEKLVKEYCKLDFLLKPMIDCRRNQMRQLMLEGSNIKLKDNLSSGKIDVHLFLFTDLLLICKKSISKKTNDKVKVIRPPLLVHHIIPTIMDQHHHGSTLVLIHVNEFNVAVSVYLLHMSDAKVWLEAIRKAQKRYSDAKQRAYLMQISSYTLNPGIYRTVDDDDSSMGEQQPMLYLSSSHFHSPRSSRSSLLHSYSGSMEMSESASNYPSYMGSCQTLMIPPPAPAATPTPNLLLTDDLYAGSSSHPSRARSFELGDLRNPSLSAQVDIDNFGRSHSMETRSSISVLVTSPRPERRAFLLRGSGSPSGSLTGSSHNTLLVPTAVPLVAVQQEQEQRADERRASVSKDSVAKDPVREQKQERTVILTMNTQPSCPSTSATGSISNQKVLSHVTSQSSSPQQQQQQQAQHPAPPPRHVTHAARSSSAASAATVSRKLSSSSPSQSHAPLKPTGSLTSPSTSSTVKPPPPKVPPRRPPAPVTGVSVTFGTSSSPPPSSSMTTSNKSSSPTPVLQRCPSPVNKPPLVKTKNYSDEHPDPNTEPSCTRFEEANKTSPTDTSGSGSSVTAAAPSSRIYNQKRTGRSERRYFTADAIESMKSDDAGASGISSSEVQKRLSLNYGKQQPSAGSGKHAHHLLLKQREGEADDHQQLMIGESMHSSSGISSSCQSVLSATDSECCCSTSSEIGASMEQLVTSSMRGDLGQGADAEAKRKLTSLPSVGTKTRSEYGREGLCSLRQSSRGERSRSQSPNPPSTSTTSSAARPAGKDLKRKRQFPRAKEVALEFM